MSEIPQKIGPYRVVQRLGAGGMGEVLLAYDERLDRRVAIKRIRPEAVSSPDQRERFRREARVAARLNHPAIVQVYDILQEEEVEHIVMEYVEGTTLCALAGQGPLDLPLALRLAREIADGLDTAHHEGIVHRDLKTENVLVTRAGHAKISDFGIAKQLLAGPEPALTQGNAVVGTCRAMSPEQARGEAVDQRSDLFSFGVLLYEVLTGRSPFAAENPLATLNRILVHTPEPVQALRPEVPEEISGLVGQLLQKDPFLRPRSAGEVRWQLDALLAPGTASMEEPTLLEGGLFPPSGRHSTPLPKRGGTHSAPPAPDSALTTVQPRSRRIALSVLAVLLAAALAAAGAWLLARRPPLSVAVLAPEITKGGGSGEVELLASGVRVALLQGVVGLRGISAKASDDVDEVSGSPREVARAVSADEVVASRLDCQPELESCRVALSRIAAADGHVIWAGSFEIPLDDVYLAARAVTNQIRGGYPDHAVRPGGEKREVSPGDFEECLRLRQRFNARRETSLAPILAGLAAIRARSPRFVEAFLLEAEVARYKFYGSRDPRDLQHAFELVQEARRIAPEDPQTLFTLFSIALDGGRLDEAEGALDSLDRLTPGDAAVEERRAQLLNAQGRPKEAIELLRSVVRQRPSWKRLYKLASMEYQRGETAAARRHLGDLLERSPGNLNGLSLLAQIELVSGDPQRAVELYSEIVRRAPGLTELGNLGLAYFLQGRYREASEVFRRLAAQAPDNPLIALNLADSYLLMGRRAEADAVYREILSLLARDPSAASEPQFLTVKGQALAHLGQGPAAVAAIQEALRLAPDNAQVAYEASLVYTLLGEDNSALVNAQRALDLGYERRWFSFPWFDSVRAHPDLAARLQEGGD